MHLAGKIFAIFTLLLAVGAILLTAKTLDKQNEWNERLDKARESYASAAEKLPEVEEKALELRDELTRTRLNWGRHWDGVQVVPRNLEAGQVTIGIGRNQKLSRPGENGEQLPLLHAFQPNDDGQMQYVGAFRVTQIDTTQAALQLERTPREGETATWNVNRPWRFRDSMPAGKRAQIGELLLELTLIEQRMSDRELNLQIQNKSVQAAQNMLDQRLAELQGDETLPEQAGEEYRLGLVEALRNAEANRDAALAEVQQLREELHDLYGRFENLLAENKDLESQLTGDADLPEGAEVSASRPVLETK